MFIDTHSHTISYSCFFLPDKINSGETVKNAAAPSRTSTGNGSRPKPLLSVRGKPKPQLPSSLCWLPDSPFPFEGRLGNVGQRNHLLPRPDPHDGPVVALRGTHPPQAGERPPRDGPLQTEQRGRGQSPTRRPSLASAPTLLHRQGAPEAPIDPFRTCFALVLTELKVVYCELYCQYNCCVFLIAYFTLLTTFASILCFPGPHGGSFPPNNHLHALLRVDNWISAIIFNKAYCCALLSASR